jgi:hypothetical protein
MQSSFIDGYAVMDNFPVGGGGFANVFKIRSTTDPQKLFAYKESKYK